MTDEPITEDWLRSAGFRWEMIDRDPHKHWLLWLGDAVKDREHMFASHEDLGIKVSKGLTGKEDWWHCWLRADYCGRYTRFVHVRHMRTQAELATLIAAITGFPFDVANSYYGSYRRPEDAARLRDDDEHRIEVRM